MSKFLDLDPGKGPIVDDILGDPWLETIIGTGTTFAVISLVVCL